VLLIEGLSLYDFQAHESQFPTITDIFKDRVEVITPPVYNGSLVEELAAVPLTGTQKHKLLNREFVIAILQGMFLIRINFQ
jgi:RNA exonuclease 1